METEGVVVMGAGGHAKVCVEILEAMGEKVVACLDGRPEGPAALMGVPILRGAGQLERLRAEGRGRVFVAVGDNAARSRCADEAAALGYRLVSAISPAASISRTALIGEGAAIMPGAVVNADARIGALAIINTGACVDHDCVVGRGAHVAPGCVLAGGANIGAGVFLGAGCVVIPGRKVGDHALLGAGAVVVSDIPDRAKAFGVPARISGD